MPLITREPGTRSKSWLTSTIYSGEECNSERAILPAGFPPASLPTSLFNTTLCFHVSMLRTSVEMSMGAAHRALDTQNKPHKAKVMVIVSLALDLSRSRTHSLTHQKLNSVSHSVCVSGGMPVMRKSGSAQPYSLPYLARVACGVVCHNHKQTHVMPLPCGAG